MFEVSDKVVCVDDQPPIHPVGYKLKKGTVYVVESIDSVPDGRGDFGLFLTGVPNFRMGNRLIPWRSTRFRKLSEIKAENAERAKKEEILRKAFFSSPLNPWVDNNP